ncbi:hypothetical protein G6F68_018459 [Rhizopus microsporus]|nr:hypothetical protein G6F68_018459 [Rhizopus microsporus]
MIKSILDVNNFETTNMTFTMNQLTNTTNVTTTSNHNNITHIKLDKIFNLASFNIETNGIIRLDQRIRITNGTTVMSSNVRNTLRTNQYLLDLAQFVLGLFVGNTMNSKATFNVIDETEVFTSLFN